MSVQNDKLKSLSKINNGQWRINKFYKTQNRKGKPLNERPLNYITVFIKDDTSSRIDPKRDFGEKFLKGFIRTGQMVSLSFNSFI